MKIISDDVRNLIGKDSQFAKMCDGYEERTEQLEMSLAVADAFNNNKKLLVEAGTGVGKTMAYLIPAILKASDELPIIISTNTIALQSQLVAKDLPDIAKAMKDIPFSYELVKGRGNYVCLSEVDYASESVLFAADPLFERFKKWLKETKTGDFQDLPFEFGEWIEVASNVHTCRREECSYYQKGMCFYYNMRKRAEHANIIVTNHSLFFSDLACKLSSVKISRDTSNFVEDAFAGILPLYSAVVFDEAHHLEDVAGKIFGFEFSSSMIPFLMKRLRNRRDFTLPTSLLDMSADINDKLFESFSEITKQDYFLDDAYKQLSRGDLEEKANNLLTHTDSLITEMNAEKSKNSDKEVKDKIDSYISMFEEMTGSLRAVFFDSSEDYFRWGENKTGDRYNSCILHSSPTSVAQILRDSLFERDDISIVMTSATLSNSGNFDYIKKRLGISGMDDLPGFEQEDLEIEELILGSPFDYMKQLLLYVPEHTPQPNDSDNYAREITNIIKDLIDASGGHAFMLFTSYKMLNKVFENICDYKEYRFLKQGEMSNEQLLAEFRKDERTCLMGVASFWEGIDVKGDRLRLVIIDKIPFAVPDNPTTKARCDYIDANGGSSFKDYSVPSAIIKLKQGFGRLIRTKEDKGIVAILDSRIHTKSYRVDIIKSLPRCKGTKKIEKVKDFFDFHFKD